MSKAEPLSEIYIYPAAVARIAELEVKNQELENRIAELEAQIDTWQQERAVVVAERDRFADALRKAEVYENKHK